MKNFEEKEIKDMSTVTGGQTEKFTVTASVEGKKFSLDFKWEPNKIIQSAL